MVSQAQFLAAKAKRYHRILDIKYVEILEILGQVINVEGRLDDTAVERAPFKATRRTILRKFGSHTRIEAMFGVYPRVLSDMGASARIIADIERTKTGVWGPFRLFTGQTPTGCWR